MSMFSHRDTARAVARTVRPLTLMRKVLWSALIVALDGCTRVRSTDHCLHLTLRGGQFIVLVSFGVGAIGDVLTLIAELLRFKHRYPTVSGVRAM